MALRAFPFRTKLELLRINSRHRIFTKVILILQVWLNTGVQQLLCRLLPILEHPINSQKSSVYFSFKGLSRSPALSLPCIRLPLLSYLDSRSPLNFSGFPPSSSPVLPLHCLECLCSKFANLTVLLKHKMLCFPLFRLTFNLLYMVYEAVQDIHAPFRASASLSNLVLLKTVLSSHESLLLYVQRIMCHNSCHLFK